MKRRISLDSLSMSTVGFPIVSNQATRAILKDLRDAPNGLGPDSIREVLGNRVVS